MASQVKRALAALASNMKLVEVNPHAESAWASGDLSYKLRPVQQKMSVVLDRGGSMKRVLNCSRRIGKSYLACLKAVSLGLQKPEAQVRIAAPTQKALRKIIHPIIRDISRDAPPSHKPIWKAADGFYLLPSSGAELHMAGCNNGHEEDLRGTKADLAIIEEAGSVKQLKYVVDDILMPQLLTTGGPLWMISTPPRTPVHDFVTYAQEAKQKDAYAEFNIHQSGYNPRVIEKFCEEAGGPRSTTWRREYLCEFVVDENYAIIPEWDDAYAEEVPRDDFFRFYFTYVGMDTGVRDLTVALFCFYDFKNARLIVEDELWMNGPQMTTERLAAAIREKETRIWGEKTVHLRVADNDNLILLQDLGLMHGLHFAATSKDTLEAMVNHVRIWVGNRRVRVNPRCAQLIGCLKYGIWDENRKQFERSSVYGHFDALAALIYTIRNVDVNTNPIPQNLGMDPANWHIGADLTKTETEKAVLAMMGRKKG